MDPLIAVALITVVGTIIAALLGWHSTTTNARTATRNAAQEAADKTLELTRQALLDLMHTRLEEMANQLGSARQSLARARKEAAALKSENEELRAQLRGEHHGQGDMT